MFLNIIKNISADPEEANVSRSMFKRDDEMFLM